MNNPMELHGERTVAMHEAAHAVVAWVLGVPCEQLTIKGKKLDADVEWAGRCDHDARKMRSETVAQIALAGAISDLKSLGAGCISEQDDADVNDVLAHIVVPDSSLPAIASALLEEVRQDREDDRKSPLPNPDLKVTFDGKTRKVQCCIGEVLGDMQVIDQKYKYHEMDSPDQDTLAGLLRKARDILDKPENWNAVIRLGDRLMGTKQWEVVEKELSGTNVENELEKALGDRRK